MPKDKKKNLLKRKLNYATRKLSVGLVSGLIAMTFLFSSGAVNTVFAGGVIRRGSSGDKEASIFYANNGSNPNSVGKEKLSIGDIASIKVDFPENYGEENKKITITYKFNYQGKMYFSGRPNFWFSMPKGVTEPEKIVFKNQRGDQEFATWDDWMTNSRFVASRYQSEDDIKNDTGNPDLWEKYNDRTGEKTSNFLGSFNYNFNRAFKDGYDNTGNTLGYAEKLYNESRSIYIDWEPSGKRELNIEVTTEVIDPLKTKELAFGAGIFQTYGNVKWVNMDFVPTPHVKSYAERYEFKLPANKTIVNDLNNIGNDKKETIKKLLYELPENQSLQGKLKDGKNSIVVDNDGTTTINYADGSKDIISGNMLVEKLPEETKVDTQKPEGTLVSNGKYQYRIKPIEVNDINDIKRQEKDEALGTFIDINTTFASSLGTGSSYKWYIDPTDNLQGGVSSNFKGKYIVLLVDSENVLRLCTDYRTDEAIKRTTVLTIPKEQLYYQRGGKPPVIFDATKAKEEAGKQVDKLDYLTPEEKNKAKADINKAPNTKEEIKKALDKAIKQNDDKKKELDKKKQEAKNEIDNNKYLSEDEKQRLKDEVDKSKNQADVDKQKEEAKNKNLEEAKKKLKDEIENMDGVDEASKKQKQDEIEHSSSLQDAENKKDEFQKKVTEDQAKNEQAEADKLKEEYKRRIDDIEGLSGDEKKKFKDNIAEADNKNQMDSIIEAAKAEVNKKKAKADIDSLENLNDKQKQDFKDNIEGLISDDDINNEISKARDLDGKMKILKELEKLAQGDEVKNRKNSAAHDKQQALEKALENAKKVTPKNGDNANDSKVKKLIDELSKAIDELAPDKAKIKPPVSKAALEKAIEEAEKIKSKDKYLNADADNQTNTKEIFDNKLEEAKKIKAKDPVSQDEIDKALRELEEAKNKLNGKFKLEKNGEPAWILEEASSGTRITKKEDEESILSKIKGVPENSSISFDPIRTEGSDTIVRVHISKDGLSSAIDIKVKHDNIKPDLTLPADTTLTTLEDTINLTINAVDNESGILKIDVTGLPYWLKYDAENKRIVLKKDKKGSNKVPDSLRDEGKGLKEITVKAYDKAGNVTEKKFKLVIQTQAEKYSPIKNDKSLDYLVNENIGTGDTFIHSENLPSGTEYFWTEEINPKIYEDKDKNFAFEQSGNKQKLYLNIRYPDKSIDKIEYEFNIFENALDKPKLEEKKNGDVYIKPADDATSLTIEYKSEKDNTDKIITLTKDAGGQWQLDATDLKKGNSGEIIIPDGMTKDGTTVSVTNKKEQSKDSEKAILKLNDGSKKARDIDEITYINGSDAPGSKISNEDKAKLEKAVQDKLKAGETAELENGAEISDDSKINVVVTYDDGSKSKIKLKVKQDNEAPVIPEINIPILTKAEGFTDVDVDITDAVSGIKKVELDNLPTWLEFDEANKKIKLKPEYNSKLPNDATNTIITIKAVDNAGNESTKQIDIKVQTQAEKYSPKAKDDSDINNKLVNDLTGNGITYIEKTQGTPDLPTIGTTYKWKDADNTTKDSLPLDVASDNINKTLVITYPDNSTDELEITFHVKEKAPSEPDIVALKNGDVKITPQQETDKLKLTYTPENQNDEKTIEIIKIGDTWKAPENSGIKIENGNIIISDELIKDNSKVSVTATKGNSDDTPKVEVTTSATKPSNPAKEIYIKGSTDVGGTLSSEDRDRIIESLEENNKNGATPSIDENTKLELDNEGNKVVDIMLKYDDGSQDIIKAKLISDSLAPVITKPEDKIVTKKEGFTEIDINVNDDGSGLKDDDSAIKIEGLPNWLEYDKVNKKIKLKSGINEIPQDATAVRITIKATDKLGNEAQESFNINVQTQADKYAPESKNILNEKQRGENTGKAEDNVKLPDNNNFPIGTKFNWEDNHLSTDTPLSLDELGDNIIKRLVITYPDNSTDEVDIKFKVIEKTPSKLIFEEKKNGDIHIIAGDADKIILDFTNNEGKKQTILIEKDITNNKWKTKEGIEVSDNGDVIVKADLIKNAAQVEASSTKGNSLPSEKIKHIITTTKPKDSLKGIYLKDNISKTNTINEESKKKILDSLTEENKNGGIATIEDTTVKDENGNKIVDVVITYDDDSKNIIKVKVIEDTSAPNITKPTDIKVAKGEKLENISVVAIDDGIGLKDNDPIEVEALPEWLEFDKENNIIKVKPEHHNRVPDDAKTEQIVIKATDKLGNEAEHIFNLTVVRAKDIIPNSPVIIEGSDEIGSDISDSDKQKIKDKLINVDNATISIKDAAKIEQGKDGEPVVKVTVEYEDGYKKEIEVPVEQEAIKKYGIKEPDEKLVVNDINNLNSDEKEKVRENVVRANKDNIKEDFVVDIAEDGSATVKLAKDPSKSVGTIPGTRLVTSSYAAKITPLIPKKTEVIIANRLTENERKLVKHKVIEANVDIFPENTNVDVMGDGTAIITYPDNSVDTIKGSDLVVGLKPEKSMADEITPTIPEKTEVSNITKLTQEEKNEIKNKLEEKNTFPDNTQVEITGDGTANINYPDNSTDTIKSEELIIQKPDDNDNDNDQISDAKKNPPKKPDEKINVVNNNHLSEQEKEIIKEKIKELNPNLDENKINVEDDGTTTIEHDDGSASTIPGKDLIDSANKSTPSDATAPSIPVEKEKVKDSSKLSDEEKQKIKDKIQQENPDNQNVEVGNDGTTKITDADGKVTIIPGNELVEDDDKVNIPPTKAQITDIALPNQKIKVADSDKLSDEEKEEVKKAIKDSNPNKLDNAKLKVENNGTTSIEFEDGSIKTIDKDSLVEEKSKDLDPAIQATPPTDAEQKDIKAPDSIEIGNIGKLTEEEKKKVKDNVEKANPDKLDGADIKVIGDGSVIITFPDDSVTTIPSEKTVRVSKNSGSPAINYVPEYPLDLHKNEVKKVLDKEVEEQKEKLENSDKLDQFEKEEAKKKLIKRYEDTIKEIDEATDDESLVNAVLKGRKLIEDTERDSITIPSSNSSGFGNSVIAKRINSSKPENDNKSNFEQIRQRAIDELLKKASERKEAIENNPSIDKSNKDIMRISLSSRKLRYKSELEEAKDELEIKNILEKALKSFDDIVEVNSNITEQKSENKKLKDIKNIHKIPKTSDTDDSAKLATGLLFSLGAAFALAKKRKKEENI